MSWDPRDFVRCLTMVGEECGKGRTCSLFKGGCFRVL